jgi:hypothetical protein
VDGLRRDPGRRRHPHRRHHGLVGGAVRRAGPARPGGHAARLAPPENVAAISVGVVGGGPLLDWTMRRTPPPRWT